MPTRWLPRPALPKLTDSLRELPALRGLLKTVRGAALERYPCAGGGAPVLLVPGFIAGDGALAALAAHLAEAGYVPYPARIAINVDCSEATTRHLTARLEQIAADHDEPVAIVGHSRGGMLAHVLARRRPDLVSGVVTLGSPNREPLAISAWVLASALALAGAGSAGVAGLLRLSCAAGPCCAGFRRDLAAEMPAGVHFLSVFSPRDGIVNWRACLDPAGRNVEVHTSHCGMASDPVTLHVVERALARFQRRGPAALWLAA